MTDNIQRYGFRWVGSLVSAGQPSPIRGFCATGVNFNINGDATNYNLNAGDPVKQLSTGYWTLAGGYENGSNVADAVMGIVTKVEPYYDAGLRRMKPSPYLPSGVSWGTNFERISMIMITPVLGQIFEIDVDAATSTTFATYLDTFGLNFDHQLAGTTGNLMVNPRLHTAAGSGTATAGWRVLRLSDNLENRDLTGNYVKVLVTANESTLPPFTATGV